jgi:hypothetical protein
MYPLELFLKVPKIQSRSILTGADRQNHERGTGEVGYMQRERRHEREPRMNERKG